MSNGYDHNAMQAREGEPCECCGRPSHHWHHAVVHRMRGKPELNAMFQPATPMYDMPSLVSFKRLRGTLHSLADELFEIR